MNVAVSLDSLAITPPVAHPTPPPTPKPVPKPIPPPTFLLEMGSQGVSVKKLQYRLGITADGIFGPIAEAVMKAFQRAHGLVVDGIVDVKMWGKLFG